MLLLPEIEWEQSIFSVEDQLAHDFGTLVCLDSRKRVGCDHEFIDLQAAQYLQSDKALGQEDGVASVNCQRLQRLKPRERRANETREFSYAPAQ